MHPDDKTEAARTVSSEPEKLPYVIHLWLAAAEEIELVLARAASLDLARAIFKAACSEHPGRRITLSQGTQTLADSSHT